MILLGIFTALTATPATLPATFRAAQCGDVVTLAAGDYGAASAPRLTCPDANRLEVRAESASFRSITIRAAQGIDWFGGNVSAPLGVDTAGITIDASRFIRVAGTTVQGHKIGITAVRGSDYQIAGNRMQGLRSDGINVTMAQRVLIEGNQVVDTRPIRAIYDPKTGKLLKDGDHADCIQFWSTANQALTTDLTIRNNYCRGEMQGIVSFDQVATGLDRIIIENNLLDGLEYWNGIVLYAARNSVIRNNVVTTKRGAKTQNVPFSPIQTWIYLKASVNTVACGNVVSAQPKGEGTEACAK